MAVSGDPTKCARCGLEFAARCENHADGIYDHYPDCPKMPLSIEKRPDGYWLMIDGRSKKACILLETNAPIVQAAIEEVAVDRESVR